MSIMKSINSTVLVILVACLMGATEPRIINRYNAIGSLDDGSKANVEDTIPPHTEYAKMARFLVHRSQWAATGTISKIDAIKGFPMVNVIAVADSPNDTQSTGNIYFLLTDLDFTGQDAKADNKMTMLFSLDQDLYCSTRGVDPMEPTCSRIMISGNVKQLKSSDDEYRFANASMDSRHPASRQWIDTHDFYLCKLEIMQIVVLDYYGGPHFVSASDYYAADPTQGSVRPSATPTFRRKSRKLSSYSSKAILNPTNEQHSLNNIQVVNVLTK